MMGVCKGNKFFPLRVDPFSEGDKNSFNRFASLENESVKTAADNIQKCYIFLRENKFKGLFYRKNKA